MINNSKTVLILGANGRFGRAAATAFSNAGWDVKRHVRPGKMPAHGPHNGFVAFQPDDTAAFAAAAHACDVIVNALNPPYPAWSRELPVMTKAVITAARSSGATIMIPGNVYNFGPNMPPVLKADTPQCADTKKGRLRTEMEAECQSASTKGVHTIILRIGDFLERQQTGGWFDTHLTGKLKKGQFVYPGKPDIDHAWGYLPDAGRAMADLANIRDQLSPFEDIPFPGHTLSGEAMRQMIAQTLGHPVQLKTFPWWVLACIAPFSPLLREVREMRYLWDTAHRLDEARFAEVLPEFKPTPVSLMFHDLLAEHLAKAHPAQTMLKPRVT